MQSWLLILCRHDEASPPQILSSGSNRGRAAGRLSLRIGANRPPLAEDRNVAYPLGRRIKRRGEPFAGKRRGEHLIDGVVLTPGMIATISELQQTGFHYVA